MSALKDESEEPLIFNFLWGIGFIGLLDTTESWSKQHIRFGTPSRTAGSILTQHCICLSALAASQSISRQRPVIYFRYPQVLRGLP